MDSHVVLLKLIKISTVNCSNRCISIGFAGYQDDCIKSMFSVGKPLVSAKIKAIARQGIKMNTSTFSAMLYYSWREG
jgi:hypothetical protein